MRFTQEQVNQAIAEMKAMRREQQERYSVELLNAKTGVRRALAFARGAHAGQVRKYTGEPYITHPIEVANILIQHKVTDQRSLVAAVLHDVIEDCGVSEEQIAREFGTTTAMDVQALTTPSGGNRARRKLIATDKVIARGPVTISVKIADIISNISDVALHDPKFASVYIEEKKATLDKFKPAFKTHEPFRAKLLDTAYDTYTEALNQLALTVLAEENQRVVDEAESEAEIQAILHQQAIDELAELALF